MAVVQLEAEDRQPENGFVSPDTTSPGLLSRVDGCVLPFLGGFGRYQRRLVVLTWIPVLFIGFSQYSDYFLLAQPNKACLRRPANQTGGPSSMHGPTDINTVRGAENAECSACSEWKFELETGLERNVVTQWSLVCDSGWKVHIAKFSLLVGSIFGFLVFGALADWFGRHPVLIVSVLFMLVFSLAVTFSVNVTMFSTLRFFEGFCLAGITLSLYVLRIEMCLPEWRFSMTMVATFVVVTGQLLMPLLAHLSRDWQILQAIIICPLLLMFSYIWIFPESLRWLLATQQYCRSKWLMGYIVKKNQVNTDLDADNILTELQRSLQKKPKKMCIVKLVGTRNLWKNIVVLCVNSLTGYGIHHCFARSMMNAEDQDITLFKNFFADYYTMASITVVSCMALCPAVTMLGRRGGLLMFMIITALASLLQLGLLELLDKYSDDLNIEHSDVLNQDFSIAFSIIGMFSSHAVSNLSIFFCAEITPTVIRGGGVGLVLASAGFGMLTAPIMELHNQKGYFLHHIIFACCTLICIICILLLPETDYQPLPETLADGEIYTRQHLLPSRKPGEQRLLLAQPESSRDYTRVHDTPLHEAAAAAASTMDSTASSAVDLTAPTVIDVSVPGNAELGDPNGHSTSPSAITPVTALVEDCVTLADGEHPSSTPLRQAVCATDPVLVSAEGPASLLVDAAEPSSDSAAQPSGDIALSHARDSRAAPAAKAIEMQPVSTSDSSSSSSSSSLFESVPMSTLVCTAVVTEPPPGSSSGSPTPLVGGTAQSLDSATLPSQEVTCHPLADPPVPLVCDRDHPSRTPSPIPLKDTAAPLPAVDCNISTDSDSSSCADSGGFSQIDSPSVGGVTSTPCNPLPPSPKRDSPAPPPPLLDSTSSCLNDFVPTSPVQLTIDPSPPPSPPVDSGHASTLESSVHLTDLDTVHAPKPSSTILPVTEIVHTSTPESIVSDTTDAVHPPSEPAVSFVTDSGADVEMDPPPATDCTVPSPVDSVVLLMTDCTSTESDTVNGETSS
ncbi:solute carrier family 22 member 23-like [Lampris incognitus]|uniref:solute carrier family 22 member 23-like n=1 Tax=Lampris incognitus TaxID=2546036 RepID=UPI0024B5548E|nr:solute carrier family 22 member 23-like [Lampris incognitus]